MRYRSRERNSSSSTTRTPLREPAWPNPFLGKQQKRPKSSWIPEHSRGSPSPLLEKTRDCPQYLPYPSYSTTNQEPRKSSKPIHWWHSDHCRQLHLRHQHPHYHPKSSFDCHGDSPKSNISSTYQELPSHLSPVNRNPYSVPSDFPVK